MDPSQCSVVVVFHPAPTPFLIENTENDDDHSIKQPEYAAKLESVFGQVFYHTTLVSAFDRVQHASTPTILLIDLDNTSSATTTIHDDNDDETVYSYSCSYSCTPSTALNDPRLALIRNSVCTVPDNVPVIACGADDNTPFMIECMHAGAVDYLLKPLPMTVIKTLFLKLHRCRPDSKMHQAASFLPSSPSLPDNAMSAASTLCSDDALQHRIQDIFSKGNRFTQTILDIYASPSSATTTRVSGFRGLSGERATLLKHKVSSWDFNPFDFGHDDLVYCAYLIFEQALVLPGLFQLPISQDQLYDFITELSGAYHDGNPYHNFAHAIDVLQCLYYFLCRLGLLSFANKPQDINHQQQQQGLPQHILRPKDIFALLIAAIGHDAAHPGVNNAFLINSASPLALLYSDRSVLESLHSMTLFQIIQKHGLDQIGGGPSSPDYLEFRKTVVTSILATDMAHHGDYVEKIHAQAQRISQGHFQSLDDASCENERLILCSALIKCADISNVTRPFLRAARWAELLVQECVSQGDLERAMGLPSLPMNDRDKIVLEDSQIGFIRFVALGLFQSVSKVLPEMTFTVEYIHSNLKRWENRKSASHDSGVGSLTEDNDPLETVGCKRRSNSLDCHTNAVEVLRKRLSLDTGYHRHHAAAAAMAAAARRRSAGSIPECEAVFHKLPTMPAYARIDHVERESAPAIDHHHHHHHHHHDYEGGPVFCQCTIQ